MWRAGSPPYARTSAGSACGRRRTASTVGMIGSRHHRPRSTSFWRTCGGRGARSPASPRRARSSATPLVRCSIIAAASAARRCAASSIGVPRAWMLRDHVAVAVGLAAARIVDDVRATGRRRCRGPGRSPSRIIATFALDLLADLVLEPDAREAGAHRRADREPARAARARDARRSSALPEPMHATADSPSATIELHVGAAASHCARTRRRATARRAGGRDRAGAGTRGGRSRATRAAGSRSARPSRRAAARRPRRARPRARPGTAARRRSRSACRRGRCRAARSCAARPRRRTAASPGGACRRARAAPGSPAAAAAAAAARRCRARRAARS